MNCILKEHELFSHEWNSAFRDKQLIRWEKPSQSSEWGFYSYYRIGAEWLDADRAIIVTPKMQHVNFTKMFMSCLVDNDEQEGFANIYNVDFEQPLIEASHLESILSPLLVVHFLSLVRRIVSKGIKRGYVHRNENLKKVKGRINIYENERNNISKKRFDRIYCEYDEYSVNIQENRLIKKTLIFCDRILQGMRDNSSYRKLRSIINLCLAKFEEVDSEIGLYEIIHVKSDKLHREYGQAVHVAQLILRRYGYSLSRAELRQEKTPVFWIDMSLLYEHYVLSLLKEAYSKTIKYQEKGVTGLPDFLYAGAEERLILDAKYIPRFENSAIDPYIVRQLSGYSRDIKILKALGYSGIRADSDCTNVPCVVIYPQESGSDTINPFIGKPILQLCGEPVEGLSRFYKICVPLPCDT